MVSTCCSALRALSMADSLFICSSSRSSSKVLSRFSSRRFSSDRELLEGRGRGRGRGREGGGEGRGGGEGERERERERGRGREGEGETSEGRWGKVSRAYVKKQPSSLKTGCTVLSNIQTK